MIRDYTVKQLIIAAGLSRGLRKSEIARVANVTSAYISKLEGQPDFVKMKLLFVAMRLEPEIREYKGESTLLMQIGQLMYDVGEKLNE